MIMLSKEKVDEMMKLKGNVKGVILKGHFDYIRDLKGEKGIVLVEKRLEELGYPIKAKEIIPTNWYSEALACLIVLVCTEVFNWTKKM